MQPLTLKKDKKIKIKKVRTSLELGPFTRKSKGLPPSHTRKYEMSW